MDRDIARDCEMQSLDDPWHRCSTIITPHGIVKVAQNETDLVASMARAALVEHEALRD